MHPNDVIELLEDALINRVAEQAFKPGTRFHHDLFIRDMTPLPRSRPAVYRSGGGARTSKMPPRQPPDSTDRQEPRPPTR